MWGKRRFVIVEEKGILQEIGELLFAVVIMIMVLGMVAFILSIFGFAFAWAGIEVWTSLPKTVWHTLTTEGIGSVICYQWDLFAIVFLAMKSIKDFIKTSSIEVAYSNLFKGVAIVQLLRQIQNAFIFHYGFWKIFGSTIGASLNYLIVPTLIMLVITRIFHK